MVCSDSSDGEEEEEEEEISSDSAGGDMLFGGDEDVEEDMSVYAARDQIDDERTREAVQREAAAIEARHRQLKDRKSSTRQVAWGAVLPLKRVAATGAKRRKLLGGRRRPLPPKQHTLAPIFAAAKKKTIAAEAGGASAQHNTTKQRKKTKRECHKKGCCKPVCSGNFYWCKAHASKEHNSKDHCKRLQQEAKKLGRERKKIVALKALVEAKRELVLSLAQSASPPCAGTCRLCGRPRARGIMVCKEHHRLGELRSKTGTRTYAELEIAVQRVDKRAEQIRTQLANVKRTTVRHMSSGEISFHMRADAKRHEVRRLRCTHCGHRWKEAPNDPQACECPMCGDANFR